MLILASRSPRRRELIQLLGYSYRAMIADVDESQVAHPDPAVNVVQTAQLKAAVIAKQLQHEGQLKKGIVVAADTTVALDGRMLGKPVDPDDARRMLVALRDHTHEVHTGVVLVDLASGQEVSGVNTAVVTMRNYTNQEIESYIATGDPLDKAGAYAIQHPVFKPVARLDGCFTGVMGLSICHLVQLLPRLKIAPKVDLTAVLAAHQQYDCSLYHTLTPD